MNNYVTLTKKNVTLCVTLFKFCDTCVTVICDTFYECDTYVTLFKSKVSHCFSPMYAMFKWCVTLYDTLFIYIENIKIYINKHIKEYIRNNRKKCHKCHTTYWQVQND